MIKIWDKHTGALIQSVTVGGNAFDSGGLDVDECGTIYAGNGSTIKVYNSSYSLINTLTVNGTIYDLRLGQNSKLYDSGDGFLQEIDLTGNVIHLNATLVDAACSGCDGSANAQLVCNNIPSSSNCIKYLWSTGDTTQTVNNLCAGTYMVSVKAGCGTTYADTITILSGIPPSITVSHNDTICIGQSANLSVSGALTYRWSPGGSLNDSTSATPIATPTVTTKYIVSGYNVAGCADRDTVTIYVDPPINLSKTAINVTCHGACNGKTIVTPSGGTIPYVYNWTGGCTTPSCINLCPGTYSLTVKDSWGCTSAIDTIVTEPTALVASITGSTPASCNGVCDGTATAIASGGTPGGAGYSYSWNTPPVQTTLIATGLCAGSYIFTVTDTNNCKDTASVIITQPPPLAIMPFAPANFCVNGSTTLTAIATGGNGGYNYVWDAPGSPAFANTASVTVTPTGTITYTVNATDSKGCIAPPDTVTLFPLPTVVFNSVMNQGCAPLCVSFTDASNISSGTIVGWDWDFGDGSIHSASQNPEHCFSTAGQYSITLTATTDHGCIATFTNVNMVTVFANPVAAFSPTPNPADVLDPTITMNNQSSSDVNYWHWNFGDNTTLSPTTSSPVHVYSKTDTGSYLATLIVHNANGCYDTVAHEIFIGPAFTFFIPNAFTPNGDGTNDYFFGSGTGIIKYDLWIFDRWGNMIFHGDALNDKWDGKANGGASEAQIDVYIWKVTLTDVFNKKHDYIGTVTLVK